MDAVPIVPPLFWGTKNTTLHELQTGDRSRATDTGLGRALASATEAVKLCRDPAQCSRQVTSMPFEPFTRSLGANDEHFRKNHERDLRYQGGRRTCERRYGCEPDLQSGSCALRRSFVVRTGCAGSIRRCRAHPG